MKKFLLGLAFVVSLSGCATTKYNYSPEAKEISEPPVGTISTAYVGEHMLTQGKMFTAEAVKVNTPNKVMLAHQVTKGIYVKVGDDDNYKYFSPHLSIEGHGSLPALYGGLPGESLTISKTENQFCILSGDGVNRCSSGLDYTEITVNVPKENSFQQTLIYSGKVGNKINVGYREFSSNSARPAFNNDVEYDISESTKIGYKGALLEILDANNQMIKYKVIKNFNTQ